MILFVILFSFLLTLPLMFGYYAYRKYPSQTLLINPDNKKDPRYFSKSFSEMLKKKWKEDDGAGIIELSQAEKIIESDKIQEFNGSCKSVVLGWEKDFVPSGSNIKFYKEIFIRENAFFYNVDLIRAAACGKKMVIDENTEIIRWIDAERQLIILDHCNLGISATSNEELIIGFDCVFRRLYAPIIRIGQYVNQIDDPFLRLKIELSYLPVLENHLRSRKHIDRDMANEHGFVEGSIIRKSTVVVLEDIIVQGNIRSHKGVRLCDGAVVCGNIFAEKNVVLGKNTWVMGTIFTQGNLICEDGVVIGCKDRLSSVIVRETIKFVDKTTVFGYISCEKQGKINREYQKVPNEEKKQEIIQQSYQKADKIVRQNLQFNSLIEFQQFAKDGFRHKEDIKTVVIPEGVRILKRSTFYNCKDLEFIHFPSTLEIIEDFCFFQCEQVQHLDFSSCHQLREIGVSAFENCINLLEIRLPDSLREVKTAAFSACCKLELINLYSSEHLKVLSSHLFKDCKSLKSFKLPETIEVIELSCFYNCLNLKQIKLSSNLKIVEDYAFYNCLNILQIDSPNSDIFNEPGFREPLPYFDIQLEEEKV